MWIIVFFGSFFIPSILGQSCTYKAEVGANFIFLTSPNYPSKYKPRTDCTWTTTAFVDYKIQLMCTDVNIPTDVLSGVLDNFTNGTNCRPDFLSVSRTGDEDFKDEIKFCGKQPFTVTSVSNKMSIRLKAGLLSSGGTFYCTLKRIINPCRCGRNKNSRSYGAQNADVTNYPMVAALKYKPFEYYCGATIITPTIALTASLCNAGREVEGLYVGLYDIDTVSSNYSAKYEVKSITNYPNIIISATDISLAIVKTYKEIDMNVGVSFACLPYKYNDFTESKVVVEGWGAFKNGNKHATIRQSVQLDVIDQEECANYYRGITNNNICTFTPNKGLCEYDTGNGLLYTGSNGRVYVFGVVYFGTYNAVCSNIFPTMSTRVTSFMRWIEGNSEGFDYCLN